MSDTVQQIKDKLSIVDVVSQYVKLERGGSSMRARCPFHAERTPSFHVSNERGTYHCFGCGVGGDIFSFVEAIEGLDFKGALKVLAEKAGVPLDYTRGKPHEKDERERLFALLETVTLFYSSKMTKEAERYLHERGLKDVTIKEFRVGWAGSAWGDAVDHLKKKGFGDKELLDAGLAKRNERGTLSDKFRNRIMFPIADSAGRIVGFSGRIFGEDASPEAPKYLNSPETVLFHKSRILYGFDKAKLAMRKLNCAVLVEGQMDLLMSHQAGWANTLAVSGTAFTIDHAALVKRMTENLVLALDADEAGIKAAGRAARAALGSGLNVKVAQLPSGLDPADLILKEGSDAWKERIKNAKDIITFLLDVLEERMPMKDKFRRAVEMVVLPFLSDVQSPIAREQYVHEIAERLGVSEGAVSEAFGKHPQQAAPVQTVRADSVSTIPERMRQAYAIALSQEKAKKPLIDVQKFREDLNEAIGDGVFQALEELPESEKEGLRFGAECRYGTTGSPVSDAKHFIRVLSIDRLSAERASLTEPLREAALSGDNEKEEELKQRSKLLTALIAKLHEQE